MPWQLWWPPLAIVGAGLVVGLAIEHVVMRRLRAWAAGTAWRGDDLVVGTIKGLPVLWATLIALHIAITQSPLGERTTRLLHTVLVLGLIVSATILAMRILVSLIAMRAPTGEGEARGASIFTNITRITVVAIGLLVAFQSMGVAVTPILTALGVGGLAVALALQPTLSNLFSGIQILMTRKIRVGDLIRLSSGEEGVVVDITWRETTIRTLPNNLVMIPNASLATSLVTNYSLPQPEIGVTANLGVAYGSDMELVRRVTLEEAREVQRAHPMAIPGFEPVVLVTGLGDFAINLLVVLRGKDFFAQGGMRSELFERLLARYAKEGIEIPFPTRTVLTRPVDAPQRPVGTEPHAADPA